MLKRNAETTLFPADRTHTPPPRRFEGRRLWARDAAFFCFLAALAVLSTAVTWAQDSLPPALNNASIVGSTLTLTYDKALDETSVPVPGSFEVTVTRSNRVVTAVAVGGRDVTLTLETPVQAGQSVQVSYTPPVTSPVQDEVGTAAAAFSTLAENSTAATVPELVGATVTGSNVVLTYGEELDAGARPQAAAYTALVVGSDRQIVGVDVYGSTVTLTLEAPLSAGETLTLGYTAPTRRAVQDVGGTKADGFTGLAMNNKTPAPPPRLWAARVEAGEVVLVYSRRLDPDFTPSGGDFEVIARTAVSHRTVPVSAVAVDGPRLVLTLAAAAVSAAESVSVTYTPGDSPIRGLDGERAAVSDHAVTVAATPVTDLARLAVTEADQAIPRVMYPAFHPDTHHYALRCNDGDAITLLLSKQTDRTHLTVNGRSYSSIHSRHQITGLSEDTDVVITLSDLGESSTYVVHCIPGHFPYITTTQRTGVSEGLITFSVRVTDPEDQLVYLYGILDNNGVPRFHRENNKRVVHFRPHPNGAYPYSFLEYHDDIPRPSGYNRTQTYEAVILDSEFNEVDRAQTTSDILHTDPHDFIVKENGEYVLLAYETAYRDLSTLLKSDGTYWGDNVPVDDSIIQVVTAGSEPLADGESVLLWNSIDHMILDDCKQHFFPHDYGHVNSLQVLDNGDIVASFRGCSQVYRINGETGDVVWKVGRSNSKSPEWRENLLTITDDPYGEFCGQHAANLLDNGNLLLFDNGAACQIDETTFLSERPSEQFSRVVEYSIDTTSNQAVFVRDHSYRNGYDAYAGSSGLVSPLANGNWLISWGSQRYLDSNLATPPPAGATLTEVDPDTHEQFLSMRMTHDGNLLATRAHRVRNDAVQHRTIDVTAPRATTATINTKSLELTFDEDIEEVSTPANRDFAVTVNGAPARLESTPTVAGRTVRLTLATPAADSDTVTVAYTGATLQDTAANPNPVAPFGPITTTNTTKVFSDIAGSTFATEIIWLTAQGITRGCGPDSYCPDDPVTRAQMATFLARALNPPATGNDYFDDDNDSTHQDNINRLAQTKITRGCGPDSYCPDDPVTRAQMATFLARALNPPATGNDYFDDDNDSTHQDNINRLARTKITRGCTPDSYCPDDPVTRAQMAAFLYRARDLIAAVRHQPQ